MMKNFSKNINSKEIQYLIKNKTAFEKVYTKPVVDDMLLNIANFNITQATAANNKKLLKTATNLKQSLTPVDSKK